MSKLKSILPFLSGLTLIELRLLKNEIDTQILSASTEKRNHFWEALVDEFSSRGITSVTTHPPATLRKYLISVEKSFLDYFAKSGFVLKRNSAYKIYRIAIAEASRYISSTPRPMTARTVCQLLSEPGGPEAILDRAFPGYGNLLPTLLTSKGENL